MRLLLFVGSLLLVSRGFALLYEGSVTKSGTQVFVTTLVDKKKYKLLGATPLMSTYVNKLSEGDFISIDGLKNSDQTSISLNSLNYVGLKSLIGTWFADAATCIHFIGYNDFTISSRVGNNCSGSQNVTYTYLLNPNTNSWVILISGDRGSYVGDITFLNTKNAQLDLYDSETGDVVRHLKLQKKK